MSNSKIEVDINVLAESLESIANSFKAVRASKLNRNAIVALIHDKSKISKKDIEIILNNLEQMDEIWLKKPIKVSRPDGGSVSQQM